MSVTATAQRLILGAAGRIALGSDARPVVGGVAQAVVSGQAAHHEQALPRTPGDRRYPAEAAQRVVVSPPQRVASLGEQRREHARADAGKRQQNGRVSRCVRPAPSSTATTSSTSRNCSTLATSSWSIWRSTHRRRRVAPDRPARPPRAPRRPFASCDAPPRKRAHTATGGARGRNRSRSPGMGPDVGLRDACRRPHGGHRTGSGWTRITPDRARR